MIEFELLKRIIEAAILAAGTPQTATQLLALFVENEATSHDDISRAIESLQADCQDRGIELVEVASGFRYQVRQDVHAWVARLWTERPSKYSRALLETMALIAYRQPITRGEIEQIRGVAVSTHIIKTLEEREWIRVVGHRDAPGKPTLFGSTRGFLDYFNLKSLDELPSLDEIRDIDDMDPQLALSPPSDELTNTVIDNDAQALAEAVAGFDSDEANSDDSDTEIDSVSDAATDTDPEDSAEATEEDGDTATPRLANNADTGDSNPIPSASETDADTTEQDA
ncbi:MAG TPA: SMC-Scp complex subunit ScpB [Dokdonella sp.]|uniref:SMC-Scp complex subunit ScpB n=1 Tax=Dokdonella sp. TaxID=2291710 RepID=UPI002D7E7A81|nr:SMC-Scp complex subunit ScpB [Dokdonella sp.]HET9033934.1 SMC-Scp complex subunit ScpB [Dokdonella sp.]